MKVEVEAAIAKSDIPKYAELRGCVNEKPLTLNTEAYPAGSIVFETFCGARDKRDGLFHGVYRFHPATGADSGAKPADLSELPGLFPPVRKTRTSTKPTTEPTPELS